MRSVCRLLILGFLAFSIDAQCVRGDLEVSSVSGRVVEDTQFATPVKGVSVVITQDKYRGKTIANTLTDDQGNFELPNIKGGKYLLSIRFPNFDPIVTRLRVRKSNREFGALLARIAPPDLSGTDSCEGSVSVVSKRN
ncbi:MAG TPA: carboxypeptidase-like regulatory domain-containing protein [Pyrinomonadaceae bacterium]|nr:carboxypeptidase-like regulatory domain-containing protein [Pyrinomonadaceae bacterium]